MKYTLDAKGKKPGRLATEVAVLLMGKNRPDYSRNKIPEITVEVTGASMLSIDAKKKEQKMYSSHSGYPGGLRRETVEKVIEKKGAKEILKKAIYGMLPKNKLRPQMMNHLTIKD